MRREGDVNMTQADDGRRTSAIEVNGTTVRFEDHVVKGREALTAIGLVPASEHQLILIRNRRTRLVGADDPIDLKQEQGGVLRAFASDRAYAFTVDEISQVWGTATLEVDELLTHWEPPAGKDWVLEREDEPDIVLRPGATITFEPQGVEDIVSRPRHGNDKLLVTVITTSGVFPAQGALRVEPAELIANVLARAARKLNLTDTADWVAQVNGADINPQYSFVQAGLSGEVDIEWGAREGGGGNA
jgi:hypothetical protein